MDLRTAPNDFFRVALVPRDERKPWLLEALDMQSWSHPSAEGRPSTVLHDRSEVERFLLDMNIDSMIAWVPEQGPTLISISPSEILSGIERARSTGFLSSVTVCSRATPVVDGIKAAREWFGRQRGATGAA